MGKDRSNRAPFPDRKISETFLHFAEPLLRDAPATATIESFEKVLMIAYTFWNAVVVADVLGDDRYLVDLRERLGREREGAAIVEQMIARKRTLFGDDARMIGTWEVRMTGDGINVRADARDPHSLPDYREPRRSGV